MKAVGVVMITADKEMKIYLFLMMLYPNRLKNSIIFIQP